MSLIGTPQLIDASSNVDASRSFTFQRVYRVWATTDYDEYDVLANLGVGIYGTHPSYAFSLVNNISCKLEHSNGVKYDNALNPAGATSLPTGNPYVYQWVATVSYGPWNPLQNSTTGDPTIIPPEIKIDGVTYEKIVDLDQAGNPLVNAAGDYFEPPIVRDQTRCTIEVTRNILGFSPSTVFAYANMTNNAVWNGFAENTVKIDPPRVVPMWSQFLNSLYSRVTFVFQFDPDTWNKKILNQGFRQLVTVGGTVYQVNLRDKNNELVSSPVLLDADGHQLAQPITSDNIVVLNFQVYESMSFEALDMDDLFTY